MNIIEAPIKKITNVVTDSILKELQSICHIENDKDHEWCSQFNRKYVHNANYDLIKDLHKYFSKKVSEMIEFELKPSYNFMSLYGKNGYCPPHFDRPQCQYTLDLQVNSDGLWPIYVKSQKFELENNEALCYSGTYHFHYRRKMPESMSFNHLIFFHFVPKEFNGPLD